MAVLPVHFLGHLCMSGECSMIICMYLSTVHIGLDRDGFEELSTYFSCGWGMAGLRSGTVNRVWFLSRLSKQA